MSNLFDVNVTEPAQEYLALRDNKDYLEVKKHYEGAWGKFEPYADSEFREEFARHPLHRLWELHLGTYLLGQEFDLKPHKAHGPDFHIVKENLNIWIEATISSEGISADAVPNPLTPDPNRLGKIPEDNIILRYTNSLSEKLKKYNKYLNKGIVSPDDIFVIAINGVDIKYEALNASPFRPIEKALFGIDQEEIIFEQDPLRIIDHKLTFRDKVKKLSQEEVSIALFLKPEYTGITGVLYSDINLWKLPENQNNNFLFMFNYLAKIKSLTKGWVGHAKYCWLEPNHYRTETVN